MNRTRLHFPFRCEEKFSPYLSLVPAREPGRMLPALRPSHGSLPLLDGLVTRLGDMQGHRTKPVFIWTSIPTGTLLDISGY